MSWKNPRPAANPADLRLILQSLERYLSLPRFERGIILGDGSVTGDDPDEGVPGQPGGTDVGAALAALEAALDALSGVDIDVPDDTVFLADPDLRAAPLEQTLLALGLDGGTAAYLAALGGSSLDDYLGTDERPDVQSALVGVGYGAQFALAAALFAYFLSSSAVQEGDARLADTRTPTDDSVTTPKLATGLVVPTDKGGTGLTSLGAPGQALRVDAGGTALEWYTP